MKTKMLYICVMLSIVYGCSSGSGDISNSGSGGGNTTTNVVWSIPVNEVHDGGSGLDGIPPLEAPNFIAADDSRVDSYMDPFDLVIGIRIGNEARAYPHRILNWHEVVNDVIEQQHITVNYCPLTGTSFAWKKKGAGIHDTFGVSGLLFNSNLILYDRASRSFWSQMKIECVGGNRLGEKPETVDLIETTWLNWKKMYPGTKVLLNAQGFDRNYLEYPYGDYLVNDELLLFPVKPLDKTFPLKKRVYGVIVGDKSKAYFYDKFTNGKVVKDRINGQDVLVIGNHEMMNSFVLPNDLKNENLQYVFQGKDAFFEDTKGNKWNIHGEVIAGPRKGEILTRVNGLASFWFSLASFYPNPEVY